MTENSLKVSKKVPKSWKTKKWSVKTVNWACKQWQIDGVNPKHNGDVPCDIPTWKK